MNLHPVWSVFPDMEARLMRVMDHFVRILEDSPSFIRDDIETLLMNPGKMLRPAFVLMSSTAGENQSDSLYAVAAAVELLHIATLIHDDVLDQSVERRGKPTLYVNQGVKKAVLAGDYLLARSLALASTASNDALVSLMNEGVSRLCLSEIEQDAGYGNYFIDRNTYFSRIRGKTAELFAVSCKAGAILGGTDPEVCDKFFELGKDFGLAFQIKDDVEDYRGLSKQMGKPSGNDLKDGIPTLPLIIALESGDPSLERICRSRLKIQMRKSIRRKVLAGGFDCEAAAVGESYKEKCLNQLSALDFLDRDLFISIIDKH